MVKLLGLKITFSVVEVSSIFLQTPWLSPMTTRARYNTLHAENSLNFCQTFTIRATSLSLSHLFFFCFFFLRGQFLNSFRFKNYSLKRNCEANCFYCHTRESFHFKLSSLSVIANYMLVTGLLKRVNISFGSMEYIVANLHLLFAC